MKKKWCHFLFKFLLIFFLLGISKSYAQNSFKVGLYNFKPLVFINEKGGAEGLFVDVLNYIAQKESWKIDYIFGSWNECKSRLENGEIDILISIGYSVQRAEIFDFTDEYLFVDWGLIYRPPNSTIQHILDLKGKKVSALKGSIYTTGFKDLLDQFGISCEIVEKNEYTEVLKSVEIKESDAGICTNVYGMLIENDYRVERTQIVFSPLKLRFAVKKNEHPDVLKKLNKYFSELKADKQSYYYDSYNRWMGFQSQKEIIPKWAWIFLSALIVFTLILFFFIQLLKKRVKQGLIAADLLNKELVEKNTDLEQIVYVSSHDLRSPLVNIQGFSRELGRAFKEMFDLISNTTPDQGGLDSIRNTIDKTYRFEIEQSLEFIFKSTAKMDQLLKGLLRLSRLGRSALVMKRIDMNQMLSDIIKTFEYKIQTTNAHVECTNLPECVGDESMLNQIFSNLIDNSLKFVSPDRKPEIKVYGFKKQDETVYCVEDNGIGIQEEYHKIIFEIFHRLDNRSPGEGLGLTIIKKILDRQNGRIWLESEPGKGSKFFISIRN